MCLSQNTIFQFQSLKRALLSLKLTSFSGSVVDIHGRPPMFLAYPCNYLNFNNFC